MAFFLLGRVDDTLELLCPDTFSSRQDALAALSRVTAEPGFDLWDAEVLLLDTDSGTPVLLVRPQQVAAAPVPEVETPTEQVDEEVGEEPLETVVVDEEESATEVLVETEPQPVPEVEAELESESVVAVEDDAIADAITEELESEEQDAAGALRDALARTAAQMEADGIVAPESIGAAVSDAPDDASEIVADKEWPWDVAPEPEPVAPEIAFVLSELEEPSLDDGSILRGSIDDDTFAAARPVIMGSYAEPRDDVPADALPADDLPVEPMGVSDLEPAVVPMPAPSGFAVPVVSDASDIIELELPAQEAAQELDADSPEQVSAVDDAHPADRDISDFILDLGAVPMPEAAAESVAEPVAEPVDMAEPVAEPIAEPVAEPAAEPVAEPAAETPQVFDDMPGVVENTCDDCIYEDTCPNRDQRLPKDCGSFSWR